MVWNLCIFQVVFSIRLQHLDHPNNILLHLFHFVEGVQGLQVDGGRADADEGVLVAHGPTIKLKNDCIFRFEAALHLE